MPKALEGDGSDRGSGDEGDVQGAPPGWRITCALKNSPPKHAPRSPKTLKLRLPAFLRCPERTLTTCLARYACPPSPRRWSSAKGIQEAEEQPLLRSVFHGKPLPRCCSRAARLFCDYSSKLLALNPHSGPAQVFKRRETLYTHVLKNTLCAEVQPGLVLEAQAYMDVRLQEDICACL